MLIGLLRLRYSNTALYPFSDYLSIWFHPVTKSEAIILLAVHLNQHFTKWSTLKPGDRQKLRLKMALCFTTAFYNRISDSPSKDGGHASGLILSEDHVVAEDSKHDNLHKLRFIKSLSVMNRYF